MQWGGDEMLSILGMRTFASTGAPELIKSCSTAPLSHSAARCAGVSSWSRSAAEEIACAFPVRAAWTRMTDTHGVKLTHCIMGERRETDGVSSGQQGDCDDRREGGVPS